MLQSRKWQVYWCAALLGGIPTAGSAQQQPARYPVKPIRVIVPVVAGGTNDIIGQVVGRRMAPALGQNLVLEARPGAGGAIGADLVAKSAPDGYTMLLYSNGHTILPSIAKSLPYDTVKDFAPVTLVTRSVGNIMVVHPSVPARSVRQFIALAKAHPGTLNYGSGGIGSPMHFASEAFNMMAGTRVAHVPYKGVAQAIVDLAGGHVELCFVSALAGLPYIQTGKLRALGITAAQRWSELPDVPTVEEAGVKGYTYVSWYGLWFPAHTPAEYVNRIRTEVAKALEDPATKRTLTEQGLLPVGSTPQDFAREIVESVEYHRELVARMGLKPQ